MNTTHADARDAAVVPVIETHRLRKVYAAGTQAEVVALDGADMRVERGEFVAITGPSGSGKSTLMNLLGCLDTPSSGTYLCDGIDVAGLDAEERALLRRDRIGFVFQGFNLLPRMSALENVAMPLGYSNVPREERMRRAQAALEAVGLGQRGHHRPGELSGGQQQRVAIARALIHEPAILFADEPTGALDSKTGEEILQLFQRLQADGHTVVLITHDPAVAAHCDRIFAMHDGVLSEQGDANGIASTPSPAKAGEGWGGVAPSPVLHATPPSIGRADVVSSPSSTSKPTQPPPGLPRPSQGEEKGA